MSLSLNTTSAESFRAYVQDYADDLLTQLFVGFESAKLFTTHEGVKGKLTLTNMTTDDLARRYSSTFAPVANAFTLAPRHLDVADAKVDLSIIPKEFESSYLGQYRKKGQDSMDLPFEGHILRQAIEKVQSEMEYAIWRGVSAAVPAPTDKLSALFNGIKKIIATEIASLSPVTTGAITNTNAVASVENTYAALGDAYRGVTVDVFLNPLDRLKFFQDYRERYGKFTDKDGSVSLEVGNANIHALAGVPANCILVTPKENIHYGYDGALDASLFNFEQEDRKIKMWCDFKIGVNFGILNSNIVAVNNQWTV